LRTGHLYYVVPEETGDITDPVLPHIHPHIAVLVEVEEEEVVVVVEIQPHPEAKDPILPHIHPHMVVLAEVEEEMEEKVEVEIQLHLPSLNHLHLTF
jgi:hypothetical protein